MWKRARVWTRTCFNTIAMQRAHTSPQEGQRGQKYITECGTPKQDCKHTRPYLNSWSLSVTRTSLVNINPWGCRDLLFFCGCCFFCCLGVCVCYSQFPRLSVFATIASPVQRHMRLRDAPSKSNFKPDECTSQDICWFCQGGSVAQVVLACVLICIVIPNLSHHLFEIFIF